MCQPVFPKSGLIIELDPTDTGKASGATLQATVSVYSHSVTVQLEGNESNPLYDLAPGIQAPSISYDVKMVFMPEINLFGSDPTVGTAHIYGSHDGFPAYEVWVRGVPVRYWSHGAHGTTPWALAPPMEEHFDTKIGILSCCGTK
jgi:hypothetical protein